MLNITYKKKKAAIEHTQKEMRKESKYFTKNN